MVLRLFYIRNAKPDLDELIVPVDVLRKSFSDPDNYDVRDEFKKFLTSIKRDVNFMVQQFEMKKSADAYARQQVHKDWCVEHWCSSQLQTD